MSSKEDYLREIYRLTDSGDSKSSTSELAREMDVTNASVSEAVQKLEQENLVCRAAYKGFTLSPMGKDEAEKLDEKNKKLKRIFSYLGLEHPENEADRVEHSISLEAVEKLEEKLL